MTILNRLRGGILPDPKNPRRLITGGTLGARRFCVEAAEVAAEFSAIVKERQPVNSNCLYSRLSRLGGTGGTASRVLNQFLREGKTIRRYELTNCAKQLRKFGKFHHALQVFRWMEMRGIKLSFGDHAVCLDLTSKTDGISAAESYFARLSLSAKNHWTYGALLNCYCENKMSEQALDLFRKLERVGLGNTMTFNCLISLYSRLDQPQKVPPLIEEMKRRGISLSTFTYNCWMQSCAHLNDMNGIEKVMKEVRKHKRCVDWTTFSNLATIYIDAGCFEKAESALRMVEAMRPGDRMAYHFLITLYAGTSNLDAAIHACDCLKSRFAMTNKSYLVMLRAMAKLDAVNQLRKLYEEWLSCCSSFDLRLANVAIKAYLKWNMVEDAKREFGIATERSHGPFSRAWELFMEFFLRRGETGLALGQMEAAVSVREWQPDPSLVQEFFMCLEEKKDIEGGEELCRMLKKVNCFDSNGYKWLIRMYIAAGRAAPEMRGRVLEDGIQIEADIENLLQMVCAN